ncbi:MAG: hypothetical protein VW875_16145 [Planctomycetaceae bacterium]
MADTFEYQCSRCNESLTLPIALLGQQGIAGHQVSSGLALAFCIMQVAAIIPFLGGLVALAGFAVWFIVVFQLKNSANDIINHKMKLEQTGNPPVRSHFEIQN